MRINEYLTNSEMFLAILVGVPVGIGIIWMAYVICVILNVAMGG